MSYETGPLVRKLKADLAKVHDQAVIDRVIAAYQCAKDAHAGQVRKSGKDYITHPLSVAIILTQLKMDEDTIVASLLHDTLEDTKLTPDELRDQFGDTVLQLVQGVTKLGKLQFGSSEEAQAENYRKMFLAMAEDVRVIVIKLADRLHNMRTLTHLRPDKQKRIARETMEIYAPLAHRLGMGQLKWELEDLSFMYLEPEAFQSIRDMVSTKREQREAYIEMFITDVQSHLKASRIGGKVTGRPKHFYSIFHKIATGDVSIEEVYDLLGIRILTDSVNACYEVLGIIHSHYKPVAGRIKDYVAMPKSNMYQSLHTTVIGPKGKPVEVQIRTEEMHRIAEHGIAAHWRYKDGEADQDGLAKLDFGWLAQILEAHKEDKDAATFITDLKLNLFSDEVFVFSPKGDVQVLPLGATPVDFAYRIHTDVGHSFSGAKVNGRIVALDYRLQSGDQVQILTGKRPNPKLGWLEHVATRQARAKIKSWFRKQALQVNREKGREELEKHLVADGFLADDVLTPEIMSTFIEDHNMKSIEDIFPLIAYGEMAPAVVVRYLKKVLKRESSASIQDKEVLQRIERRGSKANKNVSGIRVLGEDNIAVNLAKCCNPLPGDHVVGFVTLGHGVTVHREQCWNIVRLNDRDQARVIDVEWVIPEESTRYPVDLVIECLERMGLLHDLVGRITELNANIQEVKTKMDKEGRCQIFLQLGVQSNEQLQKIKRAVEVIPDVLSVYRPRS